MCVYITKEAEKGNFLDSNKQRTTTTVVVGFLILQYNNAIIMFITP